MAPTPLEETLSEGIMASFDELGRSSSVKAAPWLGSIRKAAMARFVEIGFPATSQEDWRFTNVTPIAQLPLHLAARNGQGRQLLQRELEVFTWVSLRAHRLVFVDGYFSPELSSPPLTGENGFYAGNLARALESNHPVVQAHLNRGSGRVANSFTALNTALFGDGALIHAGPGSAREEPIHLLFLATGNSHGAMAHPRNLILAERGSQFTILETYASLSDQAYLTNAVTEIIAEESAVIEHAKFQDESLAGFHMASLHAQLGRSANFVSHSFAAGARISRQNLFLQLDGPGIECILNGIYLAKGDQLVDHFMVVEHAQPHCNSHEYFNGILDGRSRGVFHGRILVRPDAQKTDAKQTNKNLLLSDDATADAKPQLEIYADDVKCTHGATVGQLDEDSIFYLRARGIGLQTARRMLIHAFASEIIDRLRQDEAREELDRLIWERLEQNPLIADSR